MASPTNGGIDLEGFGGKVSARGRNSLIVLGFLIIAAAIVYDGWQNRAAMTAQTQLLTQVLENEKAFIEGVVEVSAKDHSSIQQEMLQLKTLCLKERFSGQFLPTPTR